jgi:hypothetical protein
MITDNSEIFVTNMDQTAPQIEDHTSISLHKRKKLRPHKAISTKEPGFVPVKFDPEHCEKMEAINEVLTKIHTVNEDDKRNSIEPERVEPITTINPSNTRKTVEERSTITERNTNAQGQRIINAQLPKLLDIIQIQQAQQVQNHTSEQIIRTPSDYKNPLDVEHDRKDFEDRRKIPSTKTSSSKVQSSSSRGTLPQISKKPTTSPIVTKSTNLSQAKIEALAFLREICKNGLITEAQYREKQQEFLNSFKF